MIVFPFFFFVSSSPLSPLKPNKDPSPSSQLMSRPLSCPLMSSEQSGGETKDIWGRADREVSRRFCGLPVCFLQNQSLLLAWTLGNPRFCQVLVVRRLDPLKQGSNCHPHDPSFPSIVIIIKILSPVDGLSVQADWYHHSFSFFNFIL